MKNNLERVICYGLFPFIAIVTLFLLSQCCMETYEYEPDNVIEEFAEDIIRFEIDRTTGLPIQIDFSPMAGPEKKPLIWTDFEETRR